MTTSIQRFWRYIGRFTLVHVVIYAVVATLFLIVQDTLPEPTRVALETFTPYRRLGFLILSGQILRSALLALVLYPFYDTIVRSDRGLLVLFGALWGIALVGSVNPMPGSIEGVIYTETTLLAHAIVLVVGAVEVLAFSWLFLRWERSRAIRTKVEMERYSA